MKSVQLLPDSILGDQLVTTRSEQNYLYPHRKKPSTAAQRKVDAMKKIQELL